MAVESYGKLTKEQKNKVRELVYYVNDKPEKYEVLEDKFGFQTVMDSLGFIEKDEYEEMKPTEDGKKLIKGKFAIQNPTLKTEVLTQLVQRNRTEASELMVQELSKQKFYTTRNDKNEEVWIYIDGIYKPEGKTYIKEFCRNILGEVYTLQFNNEVLNKIEADTYIEANEFFNINYIYELPVQNGILNLKTRELKEFTPDKIFFNKLPMKYDSKIKCPNISKHFEDILASKEDVIVLEEIFGSILLKDYRIEKAIMMLGFGRNGKGKTISLMEQFVGFGNFSAVALRNMREDNFRIIDMFKSMVNLSGDLSDTSLKETGCLKQLIGRDPISADRKQLNGINFINYATLIFAANALPIVYDNTDGFWDKWVLLKFPYKFITQKEYDNLNKDKKKDKKIINPDQIKKISTTEELTGLLNLALDGLDRLMKNNNYSYSTTGGEIKKYWIRHSDSFGAFCMDCLEPDYDGFISTKELMKKYGEYRKYLKLKSTHSREIKDRLETDFGSMDERQYVYTNLENHQERGWTGIRFRSDIVKFMNDLKEHKVSKICPEPEPKPNPSYDEQVLMMEHLISNLTKEQKNNMENIRFGWVEYEKNYKLYDFEEFINKLLLNGIVFNPKAGFFQVV